MGIFSGCLIVSDIDGTLLHHGEICDENIKAIEYFKENGGYFTVATGRGLGAFDVEYKKSGANAPAIGIHGGLIYDFCKQELIYCNTLGEKDKNAVFKVLEHYPNAGCEVFCDGRPNVVRHSKDIDWHVEYQHMNAGEFTAKELLGRNWSKVIFSTENYDKFEMLEYAKTLEVEKGAFKITSAVLAKLLELYPVSNKKSTAMYFLADKLGIEHKRVFSIGDYYNDLDMIENAAYSAAVKDSPKEITDAAKYITNASCKEGAVAEFIYHIEDLLKHGKL